MKKWLKTLWLPPLSILVSLSILSGVGLFLVFRFSWERTALQHSMNVITGAAAFTAVLAISLFMIVKASLALVRQL